MKQSLCLPQYPFNFDENIKPQLYKFMEGKRDKVKARERRKKVGLDQRNMSLDTELIIQVTIQHLRGC